MKAMVIGLGPQYNYPGKIEIWRKNNTRYASNLGASLISNSLIKEFDADYIDDFSDIASLKRKYDTCIIAFATHITTWRDVSQYADILEQLNMKTIALSLGMQDYSKANTDVFKLHPSIKRLLDYVSNSSTWIGVRGHYTASILYQNGFSNVVPIGCPTMYWGLNPNLEITKPANFNKPLLVYHRALADKAYKLMESATVLGQDFEDQIIFRDDLIDDITLKNKIFSEYDNMQNSEIIKSIIKNKGIFVKDFQEWFDIIGSHDFVFGTRLHGCIAGLIQGKPSVLVPRDLRVNEIAEFFNIPTEKIENLEKKSVQDIFDKADFSKFNNTYKLRYQNYVNFLQENGIDSMLKKVPTSGFVYSQDDIYTNNKIYNMLFQNISNEISQIKKDYYENGYYTKLGKLYDVLKRIPFTKFISKRI